MEENPKPTRRWFRFSLRTLFIVVTIVAVGLGWVLTEAKRQRLVEMQLEACSAQISYSSQRPSWLPDQFDIGRLRRMKDIRLESEWEIREQSPQKNFAQAT